MSEKNINQLACPRRNMKGQYIDCTVAIVHSSNGTTEIAVPANQISKANIAAVMVSDNPRSVSGVEYIQTFVYPFILSWSQEMNEQQKEGTYYTTQDAMDHFASICKYFQDEVKQRNGNVDFSKELIVVKLTDEGNGNTGIETFLATKRWNMITPEQLNDPWERTMNLDNCQHPLSRP